MINLTIHNANTGRLVNQAGQVKKRGGGYGFWGVVREVDARTNTVDVLRDGSLIIKNIPVATSNEWVCEFKDKNYVAGARNLPPINARVFVLMPTGTYEGAFVLCSGLSSYEDAHKRAFMAKDESELHDKNNRRKTVTVGNWEISYNYQNGSCEIQSPSRADGVVIRLYDNEKEKKASIQAFGSTFIIEKEGKITIKGKKGGVIEVKDNEVHLNGTAHNAVKAEVLKTELEKNTAILKAFLTVLKTPINEAGKGAPSALQQALNGALGALQTGDFSHIANEKVKHGGGY